MGVSPPSSHAELGIDIPSILMKTKAILLHQMKSSTLDDLDFGGALVFLLALGCLHLMVRRRKRGRGRLAMARAGQRVVVESS